MVRYGEAVESSDPILQGSARQWILDYNEDDVRATATLRQWLNSDANELPSISDVLP